jgi:hypothetical protein
MKFVIMLEDFFKITVLCESGRLRVTGNRILRGILGPRRRKCQED